MIDVFDSYAAGRLQRLIRVRIPAMLPAFFAAARMGVPASVLAVTVVEWLATGAGLGSLMAISASVSDYTMLWSAVALTAALSALGLRGRRPDRGAHPAHLRPGAIDMTRAAAFAIPGDIETLTGGYILRAPPARRVARAGARCRPYPARLVLSASLAPPTWPRPRPACALIAPDRPLILVRAGLRLDRHRRAGRAADAGWWRCCITRLAHESGLDPAARDHLYRTERDNLRHAAHVLVPSPHTRALLISDYGVEPARITIAPPPAPTGPSADCPRPSRP